MKFEDMPNAMEQLMAQVEEISKRLLETQNATEDRSKPIGIKDAAVYLGMSESNLYTLVSKREIVHHKKGRLYFYKQHLDDWVNSGCVQTSHEMKRDAIRSVGARMQ